MAALRAHLLGPFQVSAHGRPVTWQSRQMRTILKALLAHCGDVVSHDRLLDIVRPSRDPDTVRLMLDHYYAGEQAEALQAFQPCCDVLKAKLDIGPTAGT